MMTLTINGKEYKVKYGYNSFADSDLLERVMQVGFLLNGAGVQSDSDILGMGKMRDIFCIVRELLFEGFKKENPVESIQAVGDLLDTYMDETPKDEDGNPTEDRGIFALFQQLGEELSEQGFLTDFINKLNQAAEMESEKVTKMPQDHKKKKPKK